MSPEPEQRSGHHEHHGEHPRSDRHRPELPPLDQAVRGLALAAGAVALGATAVAAARRVGALGLPLTALGGLAAGVSAWAAVIHLTGGERFDDHPFI